MCPISLITIRMRDGADTQAGAVPSKLICLNTRPLIKRMPMSSSCLFNGNLHWGAQDLWSNKNLSVIKTWVIHAVFGGSFYCKYSLGTKLQEKDFKVCIDKMDLIHKCLLGSFIPSFNKFLLGTSSVQKALLEVWDFTVARYGLYSPGTPIRGGATHTQ